MQWRRIRLKFPILARHADIEMQPMPREHALHTSPAIACDQRRFHANRLQPIQQFHATPIQLRFQRGLLFMTVKNNLSRPPIICRHGRQRLQDRLPCNSHLSLDPIEIKVRLSQRPIHVEEDRLR